MTENQHPQFSRIISTESRIGVEIIWVFAVSEALAETLETS